MKNFTNPIILNSPKHNTADPYVIRYDGFYYHCYAGTDGVYIAKSETLWDIDTGDLIKVYDYNSENAIKNWYAPELHKIGDRWYIYASPDHNNNNLHVMTVLESLSDCPFGEYKNLGMIKGLENKWTIDGTVLTYQNELYFVWTNCAKMYISKMSDPCTLTGETLVISEPKYDFEKRVGLINEGPAVLYKGDKIHIVYSANDSICDDYCLGLLTFNIGNDILDMNNWTKSETAVFEKTDKIFGPGHCSFTTVTENGVEVDYIVYHANLESGSGWFGRNVFIQPFHFNSENYPVFDKPQF